MPEPGGTFFNGFNNSNGTKNSEVHELISAPGYIPDHPVFMNSLHGFAAWGNDLAMERAGISRETRTPTGGEIIKDFRLFSNKSSNL